jgi:Fe-Mn family superoxide dismutase
MTYEARDFSNLIGMEGFSETLLKNHFTLYQGYVANTNRVLEALASMHKEGRSVGPEYAELRRRLGWEFNGMRLHELYFGNLGGSGELKGDRELAKRISRDFGSIENWGSDFRATAKMRGIGWVILYLDSVKGRLMNFWINEHDTGHPSGCVPLLVLDVFEHAFVTDYGLKRPEYIEAFFKNIDWEAVEGRLNP